MLTMIREEIADLVSFIWELMRERWYRQLSRNG